MDAALVLCGEDRALGVGADDDELGFLLLEIAANAGDRPARADGDDERVEVVAHLLPDLGPGRVVVRVRVRLVRVLVGLVRAGDLLGQPVGHGVVALRRVRVDGRGADDDLGAERPQQGDLLRRHLVGDDADELVALDRGGEREPDAGVPGGRLDDRAPRLELAFRLCGLDHAQPDPVLVRPAGRHVLELREQRAAELGPDVLQANDRRLADEVEQRRILARHGREA